MTRTLAIAAAALTVAAWVRHTHRPRSATFAGHSCVVARCDRPEHDRELLRERARVGVAELSGVMADASDFPKTVAEWIVRYR